MLRQQHRHIVLAPQPPHRRVSRDKKKKGSGKEKHRKLRQASVPQPSVPFPGGLRNQCPTPSVADEPSSTTYMRLGQAVCLIATGVSTPTADPGSGRGWNGKRGTLVCRGYYVGIYTEGGNQATDLVPEPEAPKGEPHQLPPGWVRRPCR